MNNTALGNSSLPLFCDNLGKRNMLPNFFCLAVRLPLNIYILQLIISQHLITAEFYALNEAIFEIFIYFYDIFGVVTHICPNAYLIMIRWFFLGFAFTGRPCLMTLICIDRYLAVVKPVVFLRFKQLTYKLVFSGIIWLVTLVSCTWSIFMPSPFIHVLKVQFIVCCVTKLCCCVAVLQALKQPGPGEGVQQREGISNKKLKAFRIILTITASIFIMYVPMLVSFILEGRVTLELSDSILNVTYTCSFISEFVQTLLFLQRSGKLPCVKWPRFLSL